MLYTFRKAGQVKKKPAAKEEPKPIELQVQCVDAEYKMTVPAGGRFTFGPAIPFELKGNRPFRGGYEYAMRIYGPGGDKDLQAVITGVQRVRNMAIPMMKKIAVETGSTMYHSDEAGFEVTNKQQKTQKLIPEDF